MKYILLLSVILLLAWRRLFVVVKCEPDSSDALRMDGSGKVIPVVRGICDDKTMTERFPVSLWWIMAI